MFTLFIVWVIGSSAEMHSSPVVFESKAQCEVAASKVRATLKDASDGYVSGTRISTLCIEGDRR